MNRLALLLLFLAASLLPGRAVEVPIAGLSFTVPEGWQPAVPASPARAAQWSVPAAKGEAEAGEVVAFFFGPGQGGDAKTNLARWTATVTTPQGLPTVGQTTAFKAGPQGAVSVNQLVIYGTYADTLAAPGLPVLPKPGFGLVGAVLDYPGGPLFLRLTGPEPLVKRLLPSFSRFIASARLPVAPAKPKP